MYEPQNAGILIIVVII